MAVLALLAGCGAVHHTVELHSGYAPVPGTAIEVGTVTNATGQAFEVNAEQMLAEALAEKLGKADLLWTGQGGAKLVLSSMIVEYEPGSAFKRWMSPGWGSTVLSVHAELKDGDRLVGSADARRTVSIGGAFTIGAWKSIFGSLAGDIVEDLREQLPKEPPPRDAVKLPLPTNGVSLRFAL